MSKLILKGSERLNFTCRSKKNVILFSVAEMSGGRNVLAETSVAEMSEHHFMWSLLGKGLVWLFYLQVNNFSVMLGRSH